MLAKKFTGEEAVCARPGASLACNNWPESSLGTSGCRSWLITLDFVVEPKRFTTRYAYSLHILHGKNCGVRFGGFATDGAGF